MTIQNLLVSHARVMAILFQAWRLRHELDDIEDFLETLNIPYPAHVFHHCRMALDEWIQWCTDLTWALHEAILFQVRNLD